MGADFRALQARFAAHIRDPQRAPPPPGLEERRLQIYRELFFNTVEDFLRGAFPVLSGRLAGPAWQAQVRGFYAEVHSAHPQLHRLAEDYVTFVASRGADDPLALPEALRELAHYEWVELALGVADQMIEGEPPSPAEVLSAPLQASPLAWLLGYRHPVQTLGNRPDDPLPAPAATYLIVNRSRADEVRFLQVEALAARLFQRIEALPGHSGEQQLAALAAELGQPADAAFVEAGRGLLERLAARDILLRAAPQP
ncbi:MAG TPA: putative DNA-binding domain-containing protein [Nevskiaceae bacterium]|nr:putative DNA-binding domain-containing protein [Nevskiaceae bacterium]